MVAEALGEWMGMWRRVSLSRERVVESGRCVMCFAFVLGFIIDRYRVLCFH